MGTGDLELVFWGLFLGAGAFAGLAAGSLAASSLAASSFAVSSLATSSLAGVSASKASLMLWGRSLRLP